MPSPRAIKNSRGAESLDCSLIYLLEFFFRLERAEPASVFAVLLLEVFVSVLLAAVATLEDVRTEFFFAIRFTSFQNNSEEAERTAERGRLPSERAFAIIKRICLFGNMQKES